MNKKAVRSSYLEIIYYLIFGVATTLVNWVIYTICTSCFMLPLAISNALAWLVAVLFAYVTNKIFVFKSHNLSVSAVLRELGIFFCTRMCSGLFEIFLPSLLYYLGMRQNILGIKGAAAKAVVSILVIIMNYIFSKFLVFREKI